MAILMSSKRSTLPLDMPESRSQNPKQYNKYGDEIFED